MSEDQNENLLVSTYIKKHENILLEHIRKQLDAESRNVLLEMAVNEQNKIIEDQNNTISSLQDTIEQSLNSVKVHTVGKETVEKQYQDLENKYNQQNNELQDLRNKLNALNSLTEENKALKSKLSTVEASTANELQDLRNKCGQYHNTIVHYQAETRDLKEKLATSESTLIAMKNNYDLVTKSLEDCEKALPQPPQKKKPNKKTTNKPVDSEWIDGNEVSD